MPMYDQVTANKRRSAVLIAVFVLFVALVCVAFTYLLQWGPVGIVVALLVAGGSAFVSYWKSDSVALAMSRAQPATIASSGAPAAKRWLSAIRSALAPCVMSRKAGSSGSANVIGESVTTGASKV